MFCEVVKLCNDKKLSLDNIQTILNIKATMNKGNISETFLKEFPNTIARIKPEVQTKAIPSPH